MRYVGPLLVATLIAGSAGAANAAQPPSPKAVETLTACRAQTDDAARLACYDQAVGGLLAAQEAGDLVVMDKQDVAKAQRESFGFNLPSFSFGNSKAQVEKVESIIREARKTPAGWLFVLEDGARWRQVDGETLPLPPRPGAKVSIRRAALSSYMLNVSGRALRVERLN